MYNILICDDEKDIVNALKIYLNDTNYQLFEAYTGKEALENIDLEDGEGYISYSGKNFINVKEKQDCNLCIKAFTNNQ